MAVMMPMGSSAGATITRAIISAANNNAAPSRAALGNRLWWSGPVARRNRCGTTMPMKPMPPETATAAPVAPATARIEVFFTR